MPVGLNASIAVLVGGLAFNTGFAQERPRQFTHTIRLNGTRPGAEMSYRSLPTLYLSAHLKLSPAADDAGKTVYWLSWDYFYLYGDFYSYRSRGYGRVPADQVVVTGFESVALRIPDLTLLEDGFVSAEDCAPSCQPATPRPAPLSGAWSLPPSAPGYYLDTEVTTGVVEKKSEMVGEGEVQLSRQSGRWMSNAACFSGTVGPLNIPCGLHDNGQMYVFKGATLEQTWTRR